MHNAYKEALLFVVFDPVKSIFISKKIEIDEGNFGRGIFTKSLIEENELLIR